MESWLTPKTVKSIISWIDSWRKSKKKPTNYEKLRKHLSDRQLFLLRYMLALERPRYPKYYARALAKWDAKKVNSGWEKASEYACQYLMIIGLVEPYGSEVFITDVGIGLLNSEQNKKRSSAVFEADLPKLS